MGISFGTASCCIAVHREGTTVVIPDSQGFRTTPSYIAFTDTGVLIGRPARDQFPSNPSNIVHNFKQFLGRKYSDILTHINLTHLTYRVVQGPGDEPQIAVTREGKQQLLSPVEIYGMLFSYLKALAETYLGTIVSQAVISVPFYFNDLQRQAVRDSAAVAGLTVLRLINESTSVCIAYHLAEASKPEEVHVMVCDVGERGMTATVIAIEEGIFEVKGVEYDSEISGEEIDKRITEHCVAEFKRNWSYNPSEIDLRRLRLQLQDAKCVLSSLAQVSISANSCSITMKRSQLDWLNKELYIRCTAFISQVLGNARVSNSAIQCVVLSGGCARIPAFQRLFTRIFPGRDVYRHIAPEETVVCGVAYQAYILTKRCEYADFDLIIIDVCPLSLGVEGANGIMYPLLLRNTTIPRRKTCLFTTVADCQHTAEINIYEGERAFARDNNYLASFSLAGLIPRPRGFPDIEVTFDIDVNGVLHVTASEASSHISANYTYLNDTGRLSREQIEAMVATAELNREKDRVDRLLAAFTSSTESKDTGIRPKEQLSLTNSSR